MHGFLYWVYPKLPAQILKNSKLPFFSIKQLYVKIKILYFAAEINDLWNQRKNNEWW